MNTARSAAAEPFVVGGGNDIWRSADRTRLGMRLTSQADEKKGTNWDLRNMKVWRMGSVKVALVPPKVPTVSWNS
jgi:hypothetical protein